MSFREVLWDALPAVVAHHEQAAHYDISVAQTLGKVAGLLQDAHDAAQSLLEGEAARLDSHLAAFPAHATAGRLEFLHLLRLLESDARVGREFAVSLSYAHRRQRDRLQQLKGPARDAAKRGSSAARDALAARTTATLRQEAAWNAGRVAHAALHAATAAMEDEGKDGGPGPKTVEKMRRKADAAERRAEAARTEHFKSVEEGNATRAVALEEQIPAALDAMQVAEEGRLHAFADMVVLGAGARQKMTAQLQATRLDSGDLEDLASVAVDVERFIAATRSVAPRPPPLVYEEYNVAEDEVCVLRPALSSMCCC